MLRAHPLKLRDGARRLEHVRYDLFINGIELNFAFGGDLHHLLTQSLLALVLPPYCGMADALRIVPRQLRRRAR